MEKYKMERPITDGILSTFSLLDRVAIVTGSGSGIGKGIALAFAQAGAHVVVADLEASTSNATVKEIRGLNGKALALRVDALDSRQVNNLVDRTMAEFGRIDILVNNVGGTQSARRAPISHTSEDIWDMVVDLNMKCTFLCSKAVSVIMTRQNKGNIINIASDAGLRPYPAELSYAAANAGVISFTESLAVQLAPYNIRVNAIAPGAIATPGALFLGDQYERVRRRGVPLGRVGNVEDIGLAAIYLASDASDYVTGITLPVRGGPTYGMQMLEEANRDWKIGNSSGRSKSSG